MQTVLSTCDCLTKSILIFTSQLSLALMGEVRLGLPSGTTTGASASRREAFLNSRRRGWSDCTGMKCEGHGDEAVESQEPRLADVLEEQTSAERDEQELGFEVGGDIVWQREGVDQGRWEGQSSGRRREDLEGPSLDSGNSHGSGTSKRIWWCRFREVKRTC